jgi:hypothetical protein
MRRSVVASVSFLFALAFAIAADTPPAPPSFNDVVKKNFDAWDKNSDGELSLEEINKAVIDPNVKGTDAAAVAALRRFARNTKAEPAKLTLEEIAKTSGQKLDSTDDEQAKEKGTLINYYHSAANRIAKVNRELFPKGKPTIDAVNQGKLGDCFCLAPLGAMCFRNPDDVVQRITKKPDGTFDVKIGKDTFNVPAPTDAEIALSANATDDGIWVNVYEKAVGAMRLKTVPEKDRPITPLDLITKGGSAGTMMGALTGHEIERFTLTMFKTDKANETEREAKLKELRTKLLTAFEEKKLVTTGTNRIVSPKPPDINGNHAYAVIGYDAKTDRITVWNPHGQNFTPKGSPNLENGYPTKDGKFEMPLPEFVKVFAGLAFEVLETK